MATNPTTDISLDQLLSHTQDGVFVLDSQRRYLMFNRACEELTGYKAEEVLGGSCGCLGVSNCSDDQGRSLESALCPGWAVFKGEAPSARQRMRITTKSGEHRWVETRYTAILGDNDEPECVIGVVRDVTEAQQREAHWAETTANLREEVERLRRQMQEHYGFAGIITRSPRMQAALERIHAACSNSVPVLIVGENGTGKEMVARTIHFNSLQKDGSFVPLSCAGTPRELLEAELFGQVGGSFGGVTRSHIGAYHAAHGGTLFLDEISALPTSTQAKLLRAMQDRLVSPPGTTEQYPANVRVIVATNRSPAELVSAGKLREDLYYRLSVITIDLPPLRARKEDLPFLVDHFIAEFNEHATRRVKEIEPGVWTALESHDWPGNVRELQNVIESALVRGSGEVLRAEEVSTAIRGRAVVQDADLETGVIQLDGLLEDIERRAIRAALRRAKGQRSLAAKLMGISRSRLYRRMEALGIVPRDEKF